MGRNKYSQSEFDAIARLLSLKGSANRAKQKEIRHQLRVGYEFNISDFNEPGKAFGEAELDAALERGAILILDDATIADMAAQVGYETQGKFSKAFKDVTQVLPTEYRKMQY